MSERVKPGTVVEIDGVAVTVGKYVRTLDCYRVSYDGPGLVAGAKLIEDAVANANRKQTHMRVLVCGPRDFRNYLYVFCVIAGLKKRYGPNLIIVEGEANGVDKFARKAAEVLGLQVDPYPADWSKGSYAGPKRNREMLENGKPRLVVAIGYGKGTADMMSLARASGVQCVWRAIWWIGKSAA